jgi:hypothetical protein
VEVFHPASKGSTSAVHACVVLLPGRGVSIKNGARGKNSNCAPFKIFKIMFIAFGFGFMDINVLIYTNIYIRSN